MTLAGEIRTLLAGQEPLSRLSALDELAYVVATSVISPSGRLTVRGNTGRARVLADAQDNGGLAWSPDGGTIAFQATDGWLALVGADGTGLRETPHRGNDPAWSPDGTRIAFARGAATAVLDLSSGFARDVGPTATSLGVHVTGVYPGAVWSPDSTRLAIQLHNGVEVVRSDGTGRELWISGTGVPAWSPNGSELAYGRRGALIVRSLTSS